MKRWFVTGAASGFGLAVTRLALAAGDRVVATDLRPGQLGSLAPGAEVLPLDVRDAGAVRTTVEDALQGGPVDVLVNSAGYGLFQSQAEACIDRFQAMLDVNVLGVARVTQALLPALRERSGTVVQLSSIAGRITLPESGFYAATKHAVEAMSEALAVECAADGVRVVLIEPGAFDTGFSARAVRSGSPRPVSGHEVSLHSTWDALRERLLAAPQDPERVAHAIVDAVEAGGAGLVRVPVGDDAVRLLAAREALGPDAWVAWLGRGVGGPDPGSAGGVVPLRDLVDVEPARLSEPAFSATAAAWRAGLLGSAWREGASPELLARLDGVWSR